MKILVIGYGSIGRRHIENLTSFFNAEVVVFTKRKYDDFLKKNKCKVLKNIDKCITEKPEIAIISNVTNLHVKTAIKLAKSGMHLFIEKPLSNSLDGIITLQRLVKEKKLITLIGCNMRFHPAIKKIKEMLSKNEIGKIISVYVENGSYLPNWHPYEDYTKSYAARDDLGGGVVLTNIHEIDYLYWFFGEVKEVLSLTGKFSDLDISVDDLSSTILRFKNNIIAEVHLDYFQNPAFRCCKIIGTKGTIYWDSNINAVRIYYTSKKKWVEKLKLKNYNLNDMYVDEMSYFLDCLKKKKQTFNNINESIKILNVALTIQKASRNKKMEKVI